MARPAMPRNDAADRYSPDMAEALRNDGTWRAATMKSAGVRAIRTPRALMTAVTTVTAAMAAMVAGSVTEPSTSLFFQQLDKPLLQALGAPHVPVAEQHQGWVDPAPEDDQGEGEAQDLVAGKPREQDGEERVEGEQGDGRHQHGERDPGLGAHERGQKFATVGIGLVEVVGHRGEGPFGGPAGGGPDHLAPGRFVGRHDVSRRAWRTRRSRSSLEWR